MIISLSQSSMTKILLGCLFMKAMIILCILRYAGIGLGPDEAQYWTWSQALDWGYYSKPPGIAWQIWLGTSLFGQTEWGIRSLSVFLGILQSLLVYRLALCTPLLSKTAFWCSLCMAFSSFGIVGSLFAITDVGFLLCWTGACVTVVSSLDKKQGPDPLYVGAWILAGALFKWPIYLFWIFFLLAWRWYFSDRSLSRICWGIALSLLGFLPSLWWNASHDWATFRHVFTTLQGGNGEHTGNTLAFLGSQALLLSPILFALLLCGLWQWMRKRKSLSPQLFFCGFVTVTSLIGMTLLSFFQKIQGNWGLFAYPTGLIVLGWDAFQVNSTRSFWVKLGLGVSVVLTTAVFIFPSFYSEVPFAANFTPSYHLNPFKHNQGWEKLSQALKNYGYDSNTHFLLSDKYQTTSVLSFYGEGKKRAYFLNLQGMRKNQFSYWPSLQKERKGQVGFFVWAENLPHLAREFEQKKQYYEQELAYYFEKVQFLGFTPLLFDGPLVVKGAMIFRCEDCNDLQPKELELY